LRNTLKSTIKSVVGQMGYQVTKLARPTVIDGLYYEPITPRASYAPWHADQLFMETYGQIQNNTLVDLYRCWELWSLVRQSAKLDGDLIEIGVWRGGTGAILAKQAATCGINGLVYLCDTFRGVVKAGAEDASYQGGEHADTSRQTVETLIHDQLKLTNVRILEGIFPDDTAHLIETSDAHFRLCHIDVDVYRSAKEILDWVWPRMVPGGIVVYDDYGFSTCQGLARFVDEQVDTKDRLVLHNLNGHAIVIKL